MRFLLVGLILLFAVLVASEDVAADQYFDSYGAISWNEERSRLDNFAQFLKRNTEMIGYIGICSRESSPPIAKLIGRKKRMEKHLINVRKVEKSRIIFLYRGKCEGSTITILQPVKKGLARPFKD